MSTASALSDLLTSRDQIAAQLVAITLNPKPTYSIESQSISWTEHFNSLTQALKEITKQINGLNPGLSISQAI